MQSVLFNHFNQLSKNVDWFIAEERLIYITYYTKETSHQMDKNCAGSGLLFMYLQFAFQRDGVHECYDVLCEET